MTLRARALSLAALTAFACAATLLAGGAPALAAPAHDACADALAYERAAAASTATRQAAYDAAVAGLTVNQTCANAQQRLVNEAYLLSMRAAASHDLNVGDWRRDLARANQLFTQCTTTPGLARTQIGDDCRTQMAFNRRYEATVLAAPSPAASPIPASPASPSPRPPG